VLGEAVFLFEPGEVGGEHARSVRLPHAVDETLDFSLEEFHPPEPEESSPARADTGRSL
jgi:hypothetical protein